MSSDKTESSGIGAGVAAYGLELIRELAGDAWESFGAGQRARLESGIGLLVVFGIRFFVAVKTGDTAARAEASGGMERIAIDVRMELEAAGIKLRRKDIGIAEHALAGLIAGLVKL